MVRVEWRDRVVVVTIDRPERRNAVDHATLLDLAAAQRDALDGDARALVLTGAPPAFCAGADLTGVESGEFVDALVTVLAGFTQLPMVTIAAVDGPALGAGTQLAIACDLRVASPTSPFGIPAAKLGLAVDRWTIDRLSAEFGASVARSMLLAAQTATAEQLHVTGAVHRLGGLADALVWADELAHLAPLTIRAHKLGLEADERFEAARVAAWASADAEEGRLAFLEKRPPVFRAE
ncbi:MAG: enoyl-CoA hydratase/isomerase family protein [Acidimicrobiales bacterium]|nr:enoyl-CoA hydratase/isomerase family protein [Acidimicrobiales bacterium]